MSEIVFINGNEFLLFEGERVRISGDPAFLYRYELRHGDSNLALPVSVEESVTVNFFGTAFTKNLCPLGRSGVTNIRSFTGCGQDIAQMENVCPKCGESLELDESKNGALCDGTVSVPVLCRKCGYLGVAKYEVTGYIDELGEEQRPENEGVFRNLPSFANEIGLADVYQEDVAQENSIPVRKGDGEWIGILIPTKAGVKERVDLVAYFEEYVADDCPGDNDTDGYRCQNCNAVYGGEGDLKNAEDLAERLSPGEIVPAGECPVCGALCHPVIKPVVMVWGEFDCARASEEEYVNMENHPVKYEFDSDAERKAFLRGVEEAIGWTEYRFMTESEQRACEEARKKVVA